jgi:hypothetical protein
MHILLPQYYWPPRTDAHPASARQEPTCAWLLPGRQEPMHAPLLLAAKDRCETRDVNDLDPRVGRRPRALCSGVVPPVHEEQLPARQLRQLRHLRAQRVRSVAASALGGREGARRQRLCSVAASVLGDSKLAQWRRMRSAASVRGGGRADAVAARYTDKFCGAICGRCSGAIDGSYTEAALSIACAHSCCYPWVISFFEGEHGRNPVDICSRKYWKGVRS